LHATTVKLPNIIADLNSCPKHCIGLHIQQLHYNYTDPERIHVRYQILAQSDNPRYQLFRERICSPWFSNFGGSN